MKIAMIGSKGVPARYGGVERVIEELGHRMVARGHEVTVYCRPYYVGEAGTHHRGMKLCPLPSLESKHLDTITHTALSIAHTLTREKPDVVHVHSLGNSPLLFPLKMLGVPSLFHIHGLEWKMAKWGRVARAYFHACERLIPWAADRVVTVADVWTRYLSGRFPGLPVSTVVNGVNPIVAGDASHLAPFGLEPARYVVFMGRLAPQKGCHLLIEAFRGLDTPLRLAIVGGPDDTETYHRRLQEMAAGDPRIVFTGFQYGDALASLLGRAAVYVHASDSEGLSLALLEAMSAARAVLSSDIPENREALGDCGAYFPPGDAAGLRAALAALLARDDLEALGARARQRTESCFSWDEATRAMLALYEEVTQARVPAKAA